MERSLSFNSGMTETYKSSSTAVLLYCTRNADDFAKQYNNTMTRKIEKWIEAKRKFRLSDKHIQMARELGLNPDKFGKLNNHKQERWKLPLTDFIEEIYFKHFKKSQPDIIKPID